MQRVQDSVRRILRRTGLRDGGDEIAIQQRGERGDTDAGGRATEELENGNPNRLYHNQRDGSFRDVTEELGFGWFETERSGNPSWS